MLSSVVGMRTLLPCCANFTPDIPQGGISVAEKNGETFRSKLLQSGCSDEIATTILLTGQKSGRRIGRNYGQTFLGEIVLHWLCRMNYQTPPQVLRI